MIDGQADTGRLTEIIVISGGRVVIIAAAAIDVSGTAHAIHTVTVCSIR